MNVKKTYALQNLGCASCAARWRKDQRVGRRAELHGQLYDLPADHRGRRSAAARIAEEANRIVRRIEPQASVKL